MRELTSITVIRPSQALSPQKIDQFGLHTHLEGLISNTYKTWISMCKNKKFDLLEEALNNFLTSNDIINHTQQIPTDLRELVAWAAYEGFEFDIKTFAARINFKKIWNEFGKEIKEGIINPQSSYFQLRTQLSDQLLAEVLIGREQPSELDIPNTIKTLELVKEIYIRGRENLTIDVNKHYDKPMVLDVSLFDFLKCHHRLTPSSIIREDATVEEKKCRCQEEPQKDPCECTCSDECVEQNPCCAEITPYMSELFVVKDELVCYEPGEISYIENVMQSEIRERTHRHLLREENYTETEEETHTFEERDHRVEQHFSLQKEIDKVVERQLGVNAGVSYSNKQSGLVVSSNLKAYANTSYKQARKDAKRIVQDEAKNVITQAISRVEKKLRTVSSTKLINEVEETNRHVFGGTTGAPAHLSGQYFTVNEKRKAQVYSYGYRMMLDFTVFEPAELLKRLLEEGFDMKKPEKPCIDIEGIGTTDEDWLTYVQCYGFFDLERPPMLKPGKIIKVEINERQDKLNWIKEQVVDIEPGYKATEIWLREEPAINPASGNRHVTFTLGGQQLQDYGTGQPNNDVRGPLPVNMTGRNYLHIDTDGVREVRGVICIRLESIEQVDLLPWKLDVFTRIMKKYQAELAAYEAAKTEHERQKQNTFSQNSFILANMLKKQLKQAAINYISCQFFDKNDVIKNRVKPCGFPQMDLEEAKREGEFVRFFEQAFEWQFMNYMLYPYFYARKCSWADKLKEEAPNGLFTEFLQAGAARLSIPVRPDFEGFVTTYLINRRFNPFNIPLIPQNLVPIHEEIKEMKQNFNTDRAGHIIHDMTLTGLSLAPNQILLRDNTDYFVASVFDQAEADKDKDREIFINCKRYRILSIAYDATTGEIILTLDRPFEEELDKVWDWSTGAVFVGAAWEFYVPTKLVWLRKEGGCLPCYPIACDESNIGT